MKTLTGSYLLSQRSDHPTKHPRFLRFTNPVIKCSGHRPRDTSQTVIRRPRSWGDRRVGGIRNVRRWETRYGPDVPVKTFRRLQLLELSESFPSSLGRVREGVSGEVLHVPLVSSVLMHTWVECFGRALGLEDGYGDGSVRVVVKRPCVTSYSPLSGGSPEDLWDFRKFWVY